MPYTDAMVARSGIGGRVGNDSERHLHQGIRARDRSASLPSWLTVVG
ncbi:hypothetical protein OG288_20130 [Streptomyces tauricus]|uniref:Uncharacterized protein n=1 Tax=Streptomyces tauricus TaxID=68274 RepID=A0ABZ1JHB3_9ACTN|nr:hypothetical protein [Streptomyces tauricus]MCW8101588.1 hypothetical protein [Streptomyces tauricus]